MKVVVVYALIVFAAILIFIPFSGAKKCFKYDTCETNTYNTSNNVIMECVECVQWKCLRNGILYGGHGCKGDDNICKDGKNQDGESYFNATNCYFIHTIKHDTPYNVCMFPFEKYISKDGECTPNEGQTFSNNSLSITTSTSGELTSDGSSTNNNGGSASGGTTTSSKDESKTVGISTIGGMMLLGWIFNRF